MAHRVLEVQALPDYRISVTFEDGTRGQFDLSDQLTGPMFEPLMDRKLFGQVTVDAYGAVCWPNGADLAPDGLYKRMQRAVETPR